MVLYTSSSCWLLSHVIFLMLRKKELLAKLICEFAQFCKHLFLSQLEKSHVTQLPTAKTLRTCRIKSVQDFLVKLGVKPLMHLLEISTFSLNGVIVRLTKIMHRAPKNWAHFY